MPYIFVKFNNLKSGAHLQFCGGNAGYIDMCSINGFTWQDDELIRRMNKTTAHRGPDGTGAFTAPGISLGHNRLAIIDLSPAAAQPMKSADGRFVISFNGEIYNYRELRKELAGYPFKSESDTEVILTAYATWGTGAFSRLNGIFALALWDAKEEKLLLVRDPVGVKPLYYFECDGQLVFASEIKAILLHSSISRRIDPLALDLYLRLNYVPAPLTLFAGIKKLLPGEILTYRGGTVLVPYSEARPRGMASRASFDEQKVALREQVRASVAAQMVSDRPVGLYLSGGIDSTVVLEAMTRASGKVESFSVGFELTKEEQAEKFNADFLLARRTARHFGATHHEVLLSPDEILPLFEDAVYHLDEPVSNATSIPMLKLARFAKERVAVALGGDGGDELFGGYERYRLSLLSSYYRRLPRLLRRSADLVFPRLAKLDTAEGIERYVQFHFLKEDKLKPLLAPSAYHPRTAQEFFADRFFPSAERAVPEKGGLRGGGRATSGFFQQKKSVPFFGNCERHFETKFMQVDRESWLPDESLLRADKMSMAAGLEARVPLLDLSLIAFADTIPLAHKVSLFNTKIILKEAFRGFIPDELLHQPKRGWFSPGAKWLRYSHVAAFTREVLSPSYAEATRTLFNWNEVSRRLDAHLAGAYHLTELWAILSLQLWVKRFKVSL